MLLFSSVGQVLPSHYSSSTSSHKVCVSVSPNLFLFSLLSLVIFLSQSLRQLPSPSGPQSTLITFSSWTPSPLLSCQSFFSHLCLSHSSLALASSSCLLSFSHTLTSMIALCFIYCVLCPPPLSLLSQRSGYGEVCSLGEYFLLNNKMFL